MRDSEITPSQVTDLFVHRSIAIFAGAGLSVDPPSFCPDWNEFRSMILHALLSCGSSAWLLDSTQEGRFYECLVGSFRADKTRQFKPEVFMELLHDRIGDHALDSLSILKGGSYNANHLFLARAAKLGHVAIIITTN